MSNFIRNAVVASALSTGAFLGVQHEAYAAPSQDAQQESTTTTDTTQPLEATTTTEVVQAGCEDPNNINYVRDGDSEFYDGYDKTTAKFCGRIILPNPTPVFPDLVEPKVKGAQIEQLPRTGNHTSELTALGLGLIATGLVINYQGSKTKIK